MESTEHAVVGAVATGIGLAALADQYATVYLLALGAYGIDLSVFVDLDHFLIARYYAGDWSHLRAVLASPRDAVRGQEWIFEDLVVYRQRLASHAVIGTVLVAVAYPIDAGAAALTALVLAVHVSCDVLRDREIA